MLKKHSSLPAVHPGEIIREDVLPDIDKSKTDIAKALKISRQTLYDIINERQPVTAEMAVRLANCWETDPIYG